VTVRRSARLSSPRRDKPTSDDSYRDYLQSPEWKATREWALERANWRCQVCASTTVLDVHHNTYERRGHEWPSDLVVLCRECHTLFHGRMEDAKPKMVKLAEPAPAASSPEAEGLRRQAQELREALRRAWDPLEQEAILTQIQSLDRKRRELATNWRHTRAQDPNTEA
jgi:5-methylcytosine-specific restriction endonuclease McrA